MDESERRGLGLSATASSSSSFSGSGAEERRKGEKRGHGRGRRLQEKGGMAGEEIEEERKQMGKYGEARAKWERNETRALGRRKQRLDRRQEKKRAEREVSKE